MSYEILISRFIHPFILYVFVGTIISYFMVTVFKRLPVLKDARSRSLIYSLTFLIPFLAYAVYRPFSDRCTIYGHPLGVINDKLCYFGNAIAKIFTPLFILVAVLAVTKAGLSIFATRRIVRRFGFTSPGSYPKLFSVLEELCRSAGVEIPRIIVTSDRFARSFTMGYRAPVIVLSEGLLEALDQNELETVLAHELGHIARNDSVVTWITVFMRDLMFFSPIVFWIFRDLSCEKEMAADDYAIRLTNKPMAFAESLIKVWRLSPRTLFSNILLDNFMPHPNFVSYAGILELRVKRILNNEHNAACNSWSGIGVVTLISLLSILVIYWFC